MRDLVPQNVLGSYYGRRLATITGAVAVVGISGSFFVRWWESVSSPDEAIFAYSILLIGGALVFGILSPSLALRVREPLMPAALDSGRSALAVLAEPLRDRNFSQLVRFLFVWSLVSNLAIPFFAVYMLSELGLSLPSRDRLHCSWTDVEHSVRASLGSDGRSFWKQDRAVAVCFPLPLGNPRLGVHSIPRSTLPHTAVARSAPHICGCGCGGGNADSEHSDAQAGSRR